MNPGFADALRQIKLRDAAVLVPVIDDGPDARMILTQRTSKLRKHSGQVAFRVVASIRRMSLRRLPRCARRKRGNRAETGFRRDDCRLPDYRTFTGFSITPVMAVVKPGFELKINPDEVDHVFEVPLSFLMNEENHILDSRTWDAGSASSTACPIRTGTSGVSRRASCTPPGKDYSMVNVAHEDWFNAPDLKKAMALLNADGGEGRIAGGAVRNSLMQIPIADVDLATTLKPEEVIERAKAAESRLFPRASSMAR